MADRTKTLERLATVQKQMVRLSEWRLARDEQARRELAEDRQRLQEYVGEDGALGASLAKAALRALQGLDRHIAEAESRRTSSRNAFEKAKQREKAVDEISARVGRAARRRMEDQELTDVVESWLAAKATSLP